MLETEKKEKPHFRMLLKAYLVSYEPFFVLGGNDGADSSTSFDISKELSAEKHYLRERKSSVLGVRNSIRCFKIECSGVWNRRLGLECMGRGENFFSLHK